MSEDRPDQSEDYRLLPGVRLDEFLATKLASIAERFRRCTGEHLVITDGVRTPAEQAALIAARLSLGRTLLIYRRQDLATELYEEYRMAVAAKYDPQIALTGVIQAQLSRGDYISAHLSGRAVDIRSRSMTPKQRDVFLRISRSVAHRAVSYTHLTLPTN